MTTYSWGQCDGRRCLLAADNMGAPDIRFVLWIERSVTKNKPFVLRSEWPLVDIEYFSLNEAQDAAIDLHMGLSLFPFLPYPLP